MAKPAPTFYIFHGPDEFSRSEQLAKFKLQLGEPSVAAMNTSEFDGNRVTMNDLQSTCGAFPFMAERRLVIVKGLLESASGRALVAPLSDYLPTLPDWARLIFVENKRLRDDHPLVRLASEHPSGRAVPFDTPKDATGWIIKRASYYEADIEPGAAHMLAEMVGHDLRLADSEIAKLATYTNGQRPISKNDVLLLTPYAAEISVFEMVDGLGERDGAKATGALGRLLKDVTNMSEVLPLFGMIVRQFRLLIMAKDFLQDGAPGEMAGALKIHPFVARKLTGQTRNFSLAQLEAIHHHLLDTDLAIKTGRMEPRLALEMLVSTLTGK
jgi:DNA polymerase-3 subunit delta